MPASTYLANKLLEHQLGKTTYTMPTAYMALSSTLPTAAGTNVTEPSGGGYARVVTTGLWNTAASGAITNSGIVTFPKATADWLAATPIPYFELYDALSGGNMLSFGTLSASRAVQLNDTPSFAASSLTVTLT